MRLGWLLGACLFLGVPSAVYAAGPHSAANDRSRGEQVKSGTGFFVSPDNLMVTSTHIVTNCARIVVFPVDGIEREATIVASDRELDVTILWVNGAAIGNYLDDAEAHVRVGDRLFTIGYGIQPAEPYRPFYLTGTLQGESVLAGGNRVLVVQAYVPAGSSGAAIVDPQARLVGVLIGHYTAEPDRGVVVPVRSIRAFASRQGVHLPIRPASNTTNRNRDEVLLNVSALIQCPAR